MRPKNLKDCTNKWKFLDCSFLPIQGRFRPHRRFPPWGWNKMFRYWESSHSDRSSPHKGKTGLPPERRGFPAKGGIGTPPSAASAAKGNEKSPRKKIPLHTLRIQSIFSPQRTGIHRSFRLQHAEKRQRIH